MSLEFHWAAPEWVERTQRLLNSYRQWVGQELIERSGTLAEQSQRLFEAPIVVVAHGVEADPLLNYGNAVALQLWELPLDRFLGTPSRETAEPVERAERTRLLERTLAQGYVDDYQGVRVSSTGRRFLIKQATVWNVMDPAGQRCGQAATFAEWFPLPPQE